MIYAHTDEAKQDLRWLAYECSISPFSSIRLSEYELTRLEENLIGIDIESVSSFIAVLFDTFNLIKPHWSETLRHETLPALALVPGEGIRIIVEYEADGKWKSIGSSGIKIESDFPKHTLFTTLRSQRKEIGKSSATQMFIDVAKRQKPIIVYAAIASLSINLLALGTSFYSMQVYDRVIPTQGLSTLVALSIGVLIAIVLETVLKFSRSIILDHASKNMDLSYSHDIFHRFLKIRADALPKSVGTLSGQLQSYGTIRAFISSAALYIIIDFPFSLIFLLMIILIAGWYMGAIALAFLVISIVTGILFKKKIEILSATSSMASHKKLGLLVETVENAENVKATGAGWSILSRWNTLSEDSINDDIAIRHFSELSGYIAAFLQQLSYIVLVATGAYLVATTDSLTMGGLIATTILSGRVLAPIAMLPNLLVQWGRTKIAVKDINNMYSLPSDNEGIERPLSPAILEPRFVCRNVRFGYGKDTPIVSINDVTIKQGERVAILGAIGSGKSTMLKLLAGMYMPQEGSIMINGIDIHHISRNRLNEIIGYLPQNVKLFSGTIRDNLIQGLVGISDEAIIDAAGKSGLIHLLNVLPQGLDTPVPEGGESVSGGQKQMIAMTRLILAAPNLWLLDEPTASMDEGTEKHMMSVIQNQLMENKTLVLVTHKPVLLELVERIIVMTPQGIVMDGPKDAVLSKLYASMKGKQ